MESQDVFPVVRDLAGQEERHWKICIGILREKCPSLASYISNCKGYGKIATNEKFTPACATPFNQKLHDLPHCEGVVVDDARSVDKLKRELRESSFFVADFHGTTSVDDVRGHIGFITFAFQNEIFFILPHLFRTLNSSIAQGLNEFRRPVLVFRWEIEKKKCKELFDWEPEVIDVGTVAKEKKCSKSLDSIAEQVTGGKYCRRASNFHDSAIPSTSALRHRAIRACLVYDYVTEARGLGKKRGFRPRLHVQT